MSRAAITLATTVEIKLIIALWWKVRSVQPVPASFLDRRVANAAPAPTYRTYKAIFRAHLQNFPRKFAVSFWKFSNQRDVQLTPSHGVDSVMLRHQLCAVKPVYETMVNHSTCNPLLARVMARVYCLHRQLKMHHTHQRLHKGGGLLGYLNLLLTSVLSHDQLDHI